MTDRAPLNFTIGQSLTIPVEIQTIGIPLSDWDRLKKKIASGPKPSVWFFGGGCSLLGVSLTQLGEALLEPAVTLHWVFFGAAFVCSAICFAAYRVGREQDQWGRRDILDDMKHLQKLWMPDRPARQTTGLSPEQMRQIQQTIDRTPAKTSP